MYFNKIDKQIKDVNPLDYSGIGYQIQNKEMLKKIIDEPCLRACEELFDKKIRTLDSGCSKLAPDCAYVVIAYDSLDWKNKMLADRLVADGNAQLIKATNENVFRVPESMLRIEIPTTINDFVGDVSNKLCAKISGFKKQAEMIERDMDAFRKRIYSFNEKMIQMQSAKK